MYYGPYYGAIWNRMNLVIKNDQLVVVVGPCFI